jgi:hypothetical protein
MRLPTTPTRNNLSLLTAIVVIVATATVGAFSAAPAAAATCPPPPTSLQPFAPWNDTHDYVLTTGGSFEQGTAAWALTGGAAIVQGNAPNKYDKSSDSQSLYLPAGSSATSPCVTAPMIKGIVRFFAKNLGDSGGALDVQILVKGGVYDAGTITAGNGWGPSPIIVSTAPNYSGAVAYQVRLTPVGAGAAFDVDDVYFDPYCSR